MINPLFSDPLFLDIHTVILENMVDYLDDKQKEFQATMPEFSTIGLAAYSARDVEEGTIRVAIAEPEDHPKFVPLNKILIRLNNLIMTHSSIITWSEWTIPYLKAIFTYNGLHLGKVIETKPWKGEVLSLQGLLNEGRWGNSRVGFELMATRLGFGQPWDYVIASSADMPILLKSHPNLAIAYATWRIAVLKVLADRMVGNFILDYGQQSDDYQSEAAEALAWYQNENL